MVKMTAVKLRENKASGLGGGFCATLNVGAKIDGNSLFWKNEARSGGGLCFARLRHNRHVDVSETTFDRNVADDYGGGAHVNDAEAKVRDCRFMRNQADRGGGFSFNGIKPTTNNPNPPKTTLVLEVC